MRKIIAVVLVITALLCSFNMADAVQIAGPLRNEVIGKVVEVFDADAIAVRLNDGQIAYVRLLGVKASTRDGGLKYMQDNVFGRMVTLFPDFTGTVSGMQGRWNLMYVYLSDGNMNDWSINDNVNQMLIRFGYAEVDEAYSSISQYIAFQNEQRNAKSFELGMWGDGLKGYYTSSDRVNINTASSRVLETNMQGTVSDSLISNILGYRSYSPFSSVDELKFVSGMTREVFSNNKHIFTVITNINTATEKELKTLNYYETSDIDLLLHYRNANKFDSLTDLYQKAGVPKDFYDDNRYYMSVDDETPMTYAKPYKVVNINTASEAQLAGISDVGSNLAARIVSNRRNGYSLKTLMEIRQFSSLSADSVHKLSDNCHIYTDINYASVGELESLFGSSYVSREINNIINLRKISRVDRLRSVLSDDRYDRIVNHVYAGAPVNYERVNLNTATESQMREIGIPFSDTLSILSMRGRMKTASQIPVNVSAYDMKVSLYTNINTASIQELRSLNAFSESNISLIISNRDSQPFGSESELEAFFQENRLLSAYNSVRDFIVVR